MVRWAKIAGATKESCAFLDRTSYELRRDHDHSTVTIAKCRPTPQHLTATTRCSIDAVVAAGFNSPPYHSVFGRTSVTIARSIPRGPYFAGPSIEA